MKKIVSIALVKKLDNVPDTLWIGEYTDDAQPHYIDVRSGQYVKDCDEDTLTEGIRAAKFNREFPYFKPYAGGESPTLKGTCTSNPAYYTNGLYDFKRMTMLNRGEICFIGLYASAEIHTSEDGKHWSINTVRSPGIWGIESDSDAVYLEEIATEELSHLTAILKEYGFTSTQIHVALPSPTTVQEVAIK